MKTLTAPTRPHQDKSDDKPATPPPRFRTVLVPGSGWPTEASVPVSRKRAPKR